MDFEPRGESMAICDTTNVGDATARCSSYAGSDTAHACTNPPTMLRPSGQNFGGDAIPDGRCDSQGSGMHVTASRLAACIPKEPTPVPDGQAGDSNGRVGWGANFQVENLRLDADGVGGSACLEAPEGGDEPGSVLFDASCWDGVSFWAKKTPGPYGSAITLTVPDVWTSTTKMNPDTGMPYCSTSETVADSAKCDAPGAVISLTEEWTFIAVPFYLLKQKGFGVPSPIGRIDPGNIKGITFLISPGDWDFWLDDVSFYRAKRN
jgi:hypothetical protein